MRGALRKAEHVAAEDNHFLRVSYGGLEAGDDLRKINRADSQLRDAEGPFALGDEFGDAMVLYGSRAVQFRAAFDAAEFEGAEFAGGAAIWATSVRGFAAAGCGLVTAWIAGFAGATEAVL